ncbi:MAG: hypothetical protein U5K56_09935 [Halioglobus sp.]|nr:hypothetical protein [Halioglobus sp.]
MREGFGVSPSRPPRSRRYSTACARRPRGSPELHPLWEVVQRDYADQSEARQAEELLGRSAHERLNPARRRFVM